MVQQWLLGFMRGPQVDMYGEDPAAVLQRSSDNVHATISIGFPGLAQSNLALEQISAKVRKGLSAHARAVDATCQSPVIWS